MKTIWKGLCRCFFLFSWVGLALSCQPSTPKGVVVAASSNTRMVLEEVEARFEKKYGIPCELITASSGKLFAQIQNGAPYDLFLSADKHYPSQLEKSGYTAGNPQIYAQGRLALWSLRQEWNWEKQGLNHPQIKRLAIANPETAPYGRAAREVLLKLRPDLLEGSHVVMGENVAQAAQFVTSGNVEAGLIAYSLIQGQEGWYQLIDDSLHTPINQFVVRLKNHPGDKEDVDKFYNFLFSEEVQPLLKKYGYTIPD
ncbi:molybdate ABC transporter substrate-binding protein [bacterium SCSIO 12741]|nr:molybdate ABC transporter substrate-binding protein [bacterium SCSIO 12741]